MSPKLQQPLLLWQQRRWSLTGLQKRRQGLQLFSWYFSKYEMSDYRMVCRLRGGRVSGLKDSATKAAVMDE